MLVSHQSCMTRIGWKKQAFGGQVTEYAGEDLRKYGKGELEGIISQRLPARA